MRSNIYNWDKLPIVLDTKTVALIFDVTPATVKNWVYSGRIKGQKVGLKWLFSKSYIMSLLDNDTPRLGQHPFTDITGKGIG